MESAEKAIEQHNECLGVLVILTYNCNFKCKTCADPLTNKADKINRRLDEKDFEEFIRFLSKANEHFCSNEPRFEWISFTGGEVTTLPFEYIKNMCNIAHRYGFNTSMFTNGSAEDKLLELDGFLNQMVISHHYPNRAVMPNWANKFKETSIVINKLVDKNSFPTWESFDKFVDKIVKANVRYRQRFSTYGYNTPEYKENHPNWVDTAFADEKTYKGYSKRVIYKGMEFKFTEFACMISRTFIQHPNGNVNTTWYDDLSEIDYRDLNQVRLVSSKLNALNAKFKQIVANNSK
jgi:organic radical activating enzyme